MKAHRLRSDRDSDVNVGASIAPGKLTTSGRYLARAPRDDHGVAAGADQAVEQAAGSSGSPLPSELRARFESSLGADLSDVRVHTGDASASAAAAVGARAYTIGNDVHFGAGHYDPSSSGGEYLIAHEVAHTVQQRGGAARPQFKLEVSTAGDAAEVEADRAAAAMVRGGSFSIAEAPAALARDEDPDAQADDPKFVEIKQDEDLNQTIGREQDKSQVLVNQNWTFRGTTMVRDGQEQSGNKVVENAKKTGALDDLKRLTEEYDVIKAPFEGWLAQNSAVKAIESSEGLSSATPEAYKSDFDAVHTAMARDTSDKSQGTTVSTNLRQLWTQAHTAADVVSATKKLSSLSTKLQMAKNDLEVMKNKLEMAKKDEEVAKDKEKLKAIDEKIEKICKIVEGIAKVTAAVASMAATGGATAAIAAPTMAGVAEERMAASMTMEENFAQVAKQEEFEEAEAAGKGDERARGAMEKVAKGGEWVESKGDMLEKGLRSTVFKTEISKYNSDIASLQGEIAALGLKNANLGGLNITLNMTAAQQEYDSAVSAVDSDKQKFSTSMKEIGRVFDRKDLDTEKNPGDAVVADLKGTTLAKGQNHSMEALFSLYAALQQRGAARGAFVELLAQCKTIPNADSILQRALDGSTSYPLVTEDDGMGGQQPVSVPIDQDPLEIGGETRNQDMVTDAGELRRVVALVKTVTTFATENDKAQQGVEARWQAVVGNAMAGKR